MNFSAEAIERIMSIDGVVAIKEASFDAKRFVETARLVKSLPSAPTVLNGNDNFLLEAYLLGAEGALLGFGTLAAREQVQLHRAAREHDLPVRSSSATCSSPCATRSSPAPVRDYRARIKHALTRLGVIDEAHVRPPLRPARPEMPATSWTARSRKRGSASGPAGSGRVPADVRRGQRAHRGELAAFARRAEDLGFDSVWATDHLLHQSRFYAVPWLDPIVSLTYVAATTSRLRLGTSVLVLPTRQPVVLAKQVATLQALADERYILGVGTGWDDREFRPSGSGGRSGAGGPTSRSRSCGDCSRASP